MFGNSKFCLNYNTMSNNEIRALPIETLSDKGFLFLWILGNQIIEATEMMAKWGYELIDLIVWVKLKDSKVYLSHGYYFMHSYEICLVGYKCPPGQVVEYISKVANNVLFAEVRKKSEKPDEIYEIIEMLMPGAKKLEIFARNNNLREGWFSIGNQLGVEYAEWTNVVDCDSCGQNIAIGLRRFKSRLRPNYDICEACLYQSKEEPADLYSIENNIEDSVLHYFHQCNYCKQSPIWGLKFTCEVCDNFDLCESNLISMP